MIQDLHAPGSRDAAAHDRIETHLEDIRRFVWSRLRSDSDSEDVVQQTMLQAFANPESARRNHTRAWLFTTARRLIVDRHRTRARLALVSMADEPLREGDAAPQTPADRVHAICDARTRLRHCLACLMRRLTLLEQAGVLMKDVHGFSNDEIANRLRMPLPRFKFMLHRARERLHAVASRHVGHSCALVEKSGEGRACPIAPDPVGADGAAPRPGGAAGSGRTGIDEAALTAIRREMLDALGPDCLS